MGRSRFACGRRQSCLERALELRQEDGEVLLQVEAGSRLAGGRGGKDGSHQAWVS